MKRRTIYLAVLSLILLSLLSIAGISLGTERLLSQATLTQGPGAAAPRSITVVGEGKVRIRPDIARATIGVEVVEPSVREASAENKRVIEEVLTALKDQGVAESDIQTSGFSIWAERLNPEGSLSETNTRYHVTNNVVVVIRELDRLGNLLDAAIEAGANTMYGIEFKLEEPGLVEGNARQAAIDNARFKAEELAKLTNVKIGDVVTISEIIGSGGGFYSGAFAESAAYGGGGGTPISPGELNLTKQFQVTYAIAN